MPARFIEREHDADEIIREVLKTVRQTFLTPFDRSAITALIGSMDDAIDEMQAAASAIELYEMTEFGQEMKDMAAIIVDSARLVAEAMPLLRNVGANGERLHELTERLVRMEGHADEIHSRRPEGGIPGAPQRLCDRLHRQARDLQASRADRRRVRGRRQRHRRHRHRS